MARLGATQVCPFLCGQYFNEEYALALHIEEEHTEDSPFVAHHDGDVGPSRAKLRKTPHEQVLAFPTQEPGFQNVANWDHDGSAPSLEARRVSKQPSPLPSEDPNPDIEPNDSLEPSDEYVMCPEEGCGEEILLFEFQDHLDLHLAENAILEDISLPPAPDTSSGKMESSLSGHDQNGYSSSSVAYPRPPNVSSASSAPPSHLGNFSAFISPALRQKVAASAASTISRGRSEFRRSIRSLWDPKSKEQNSTRLGVSPCISSIRLVVGI